MYLARDTRLGEKSRSNSYRLTLPGMRSRCNAFNKRPGPHRAQPSKPDHDFGIASGSVHFILTGFIGRNARNRIFRRDFRPRKSAKSRFRFALTTARRRNNTETSNQKT